jgi:hypothetical protein
MEMLFATCSSTAGLQRTAHSICAPTAVHILLDNAREASCCGRMSAWFVNRDGRTLCWACDDARQFGKKAA